MYIYYRKRNNNYYYSIKRIIIMDRGLFFFFKFIQILGKCNKNKCNSKSIQRSNYGTAIYLNIYFIRWLLCLDYLSRSTDPITQ